MADLNRSVWRRLSWVNLFYLLATPVGAFALTPLAIHRHGWDLRIWGFAFLYGMATSLSITGGYHRLFSHLSYRASRPVKLAYLLFGAAAFQGSALKWGTDHRRHHRSVDTPDDPYNIQQGFWWAHIVWLFWEDNPKFRGQWAQDLRRDKLVAWQHRYYVPLALALGFGVPILFGWACGSVLSGLAIGACVRLVVTNHSTFFINSLCHMVGSQPYTDKNSARDSFIMAILAYGEGYHNFHHKFQSDYRNGIRWYHWDPTKWIVNVLCWAGLAGSLKRTPSSMILQARMAMDEKRGVQKGLSLESLQFIRTKVEVAQHKFRTLREDYRTMKRTVQSDARHKLDELKTELKRARREFRVALSQWRYSTRRGRLVAA